MRTGIFSHSDITAQIFTASARASYNGLSLLSDINIILINIIPLSNMVDAPNFYQ